MLTVQNRNNSTSVNFGIRIDENAYSRSYWEMSNYNGEDCDSFILSRLTNNYKEPKNTYVLDLGAGQGRNTIPIAQKGFNVSAFEINKNGVNNIKTEIERANIQNIEISKTNILDSLDTTKNADFAFMSHVSQHFNTQELGMVFKNVFDALKTGGEFVFDALIKKTHYDEYSNTKSHNIELVGNASFEEASILKTAQVHGFKFVLSTSFDEKSPNRATYEKQGSWGEIGKKDYKPVKLKWFVFKK